MTDISGQCTIVLTGISKKVDLVTFTVDSITATGYDYTGPDSVTVDKPQ
jgi:hypothetical protein